MNSFEKNLQFIMDLFEKEVPYFLDLEMSPYGISIYLYDNNTVFCELCKICMHVLEWHYCMD